MLKIGVLGAGHLGKIHLKLIKEISDYQLVGFYDLDDSKAISAERELGAKRFSDMNQLIDLADVVDIVTPTLSHFDCAMNAIKKSKHVFIEKPLAGTLEEAKKLIHLAEEANIKAMKDSSASTLSATSPTERSSYPDFSTSSLSSTTSSVSGSSGSTNGLHGWPSCSSSWPLPRM